MENKVNYVQASLSLFHTQRDEGNSKNKAESQKMGLRFITMYFDCSISFTLSLNTHHTLIFDYLQIINIWTYTLRRINKSTKKEMLKSKLSVLLPWLISKNGTGKFQFFEIFNCVSSKSWMWMLKNLAKKRKRRYQTLQKFCDFQSL